MRFFPALGDEGGMSQSTVRKTRENERSYCIFTTFDTNWPLLFAIYAVIVK